MFTDFVQKSFMAGKATLPVTTTQNKEYTVYDLSTFENEPEAIKVDTVNSFGYWSLGFNVDEVFKNVKELIVKYREMATQHFVDNAIQEVTNECIVKDQGPIVEIDLDETDLSDDLKDTISDEFNEILSIMKFNKKGDDYFRNWYIDGRMYVQNIVDGENPQDGIKQINFLNPINLKRIKDKEGKTFYVYEVEQDNPLLRYLVYDMDFKGFIIGEEHITFVPSGIKDSTGSFYISDLHKSIRAYNQLRLVEDASVVYSITRAPERRAFYVDVGKMTKTKAEEYLRGLMDKFKNRVIYDSTTGSTTQQKNVMTINEDFWLPTTTEGKGTKIEQLTGGTALTHLTEQVEQFKKNLLKALKVPSGRLSEEAVINIGDGNKDILREEIRFAKYVNNKREKFSELFIELLKKQLILKNIMDEEEWMRIENDIMFDWTKDQYYEEVSKQERIKTRLEILDSITKYIGKKGYFSKTYVYKEVLDMTDQEILDMIKEIDSEKKLGIAAVAGGEGEMGGDFGGGDFGAEGGFDFEAGGEEEPLEPEGEPDIEGDLGFEEVPEAGGEEAEPEEEEETV